MATTFYDKETKRGNRICLATFFGGEVYGRSLEIYFTPTNSGSLTEEEVLELRDQLNDWLSRRNEGN